MPTQPRRTQNREVLEMMHFGDLVVTLFIHGHVYEEIVCFEYARLETYVGQALAQALTDDRNITVRWNPNEWEVLSYQGKNPNIIQMRKR